MVCAVVEIGKFDCLSCWTMNKTYVYIPRLQFKGNRLETRKTNILYLLRATTQQTKLSSKAKTTNSNSGDRSK
jgi:hypothetical protein